MGYNTLANFRIEKKIGRGQFSEVYRAACLLDGVPVALKKVQVRWFQFSTSLFHRAMWILSGEKYVLIDWKLTVMLGILGKNVNCTLKAWIEGSAQ